MYQKRAISQVKGDKKLQTHKTLSTSIFAMLFPSTPSAHLILRMKHLPRKKLLVIACAHALAVMFTPQTVAADEDVSSVEVKSKATSAKLSSERKRDDEIERIEVIGYAGSVERSLASKRFAYGVIDSIIAEDIGKMPDDNVAEAMQRMTGISIDRDGGEGTTISIRGLSPELNQVSINGQTVGGTGSWDPDSGDLNSGGAGGVNFSNMSADMLSRIEVIKTPSANTVEGSLGGRVNLMTRKPLNGKKRSFSGTIKQNYNELSTNMDPSFSISYSDQFFDRTIGLAFGATVERRRGRTDKVTTGGWRLYDDITHDTNGYEYLKAASSEDTTQPDTSAPLYMRDSINGALYDSNYLDVSDSVYTANLVTAPQSGHAMGRTAYAYEEKDQTRKNVNLTLQYQATENLSTHIDLSISDLESYKLRARYTLNYLEDAFLQSEYGTDITLDDVTRGLNGVFSGMDIDENGTVVRAKDLLGRIDNRADEGTLLTTTSVANIGFNYESDVWITSGRIGYALTNEESDGYNSLRAYTGDHLMGYDSTFNYKLPEFVWGHNDKYGEELTLHAPSHRVTGIDREIYADVTGADGNNYVTPYSGHGTIRSVASAYREFESSQYSFQLDTEYLLDSDHFISLMFGLMHTNTKKYQLGDSMSFNAQFTGNSLYIDVPGGLDDFRGDNYLGGQASSGIPNQAVVSGWATPNFDSVNRQFLGMYNEFYSIPENDIEGVHTNITEISQARGLLNPSGSTESEQANSAIYAQVNVDTLDGQLKGDFGVRVVQTNVDVLGYAGELSYNNDCINAASYSHDQCLSHYTARTASNSYITVLPTANFVYFITDELLFRTSVGQAMARPSDRYLTSTHRVSANNADTATINKGNPYLKPQISSQLDLAIEWYFDQGAILSAGFYYKDIADYIYKRITKVDDILYYHNGAPVPHPDPGDNTELVDGVFVINPHYINEGINGDNAQVAGLEMRYTHQLSFLPGNWSGLGVDTNYTLADSAATYEGINEDGENFSVDYSFVGQSKHTVNASIYWEKYGHSARLSYNYRSDSLSNAISGEKDSIWNDAYAQFDFSGSYTLNEHIRIGLNVKNLLNVGQYQYSLDYASGSPLENDVFKNRLAGYQFNGRTVTATFNASF